MAPRSLLRSRLFWLGVPGLVFLLWVWWNSGGHGLFVAWQRRDWCIDAQLHRGLVEWQITRELQPAEDWEAEARPPDFYYQKLEEEDGSARARRFDFPGAFSREASTSSEFGRAIERTEVGVSMWGVSGCYAAMWLGAVCWWQWRRARVGRR